MLDIHNHVLFGLDDGCRNPEESKNLAEALRQAGHMGVVATPHIRSGIFPNTPDDIRRRRDETRPIVEGAGLQLYLGAEYYFDEHLLEGGRTKRLLTLGETSRYVLTEFPSERLPLRWQDVVFELRLRDYVPVIAHPERCRGVQEDISRALDGFHRSGVLLQLDLGSLVGNYGRSAQKTAEKLVKRGAYHLAAGDIHRPEDVSKVLEPARKALSKLTKRGKEGREWHRLCVQNPQLVVSDSSSEDISTVGS